MSKPKRISNFKEIEGKGFLFVKSLRAEREYVFDCPKCGTENTVTFGKPGMKKYFCKKCEVKFTASVKEPKNDEEKSQVVKTEGVSHTITITDDGYFKKKANAALVYGGRFGGLFGKKTVKRLKFGANVVGRNDPGEPSDINIDDDYVSRRSVEITVSKMPGGKNEVYKMTLLREPSNPVFVNSQQLTMNSGAIYLNYNDKITLGRTVMTLKKVNK